MNAPKNGFTTEEATAMAEQIGLSFDEVDFGPEDLRAGMDVELEHGHRDPRTDVTHDDPVITAKIAWAHLNEMSDYYVRLEKMEREAGS
jgi:Protein of unknown function (DUF5661)